MAERDIAEKRLEEYDDVFADIVNVLLFDGRRLVREDALSETSRLSQYKADDGLHEQERDIAKYWREGNIRICLYGLENQTAVDADIPLRVASYDGAGYRAQLLADKERGKKGCMKPVGRPPRYPVVTLVLYFGMRRWRKPRSLLERLTVPPELAPYVSDYRVNVFEIAWLPPETVAKFRSDFRIVADYFVQMRVNKDYEPSRETIRHVHEVLQLMRVLSGNRQFEDAQNSVHECDTERGGPSMYNVLAKMQRESRNEGRNEGRGEGRVSVQTLMSRMFSEGRVDDLRRASTDSAYLNQLLAEQGLLGEDTEPLATS
ncbi:MAG: hypothetical protein IJR93_13505, partial [Treponema sp.]|nr:hypothetical protein [Treponema sp.]